MQNLDISKALQVQGTVRKNTDAITALQARMQTAETNITTHENNIANLDRLSDVQYSQSGTNIIRGYATARLLVRGGRIVCSRGVSPWHSASIRATTPSLY
ncbi:hypothetical protein DPMN_111081 [Dreissena polymorpha]|uniref:Uncharacterized protein n=1 Tax=Dreissena polymorpha TaxID=45954 RepID=A0A9D4KD68_DREPO|nr:hypothetical protein DPMN_111081 [Dreissena polymorpha]